MIFLALQFYLKFENGKFKRNFKKLTSIISIEKYMVLPSHKDKLQILVSILFYFSWIKMYIFKNSICF